MTDILTIFEQFFAGFWDRILEILYIPFVWVFNGLILVNGYLFFYIFSGFITVVTNLLDILDVFGSFEILTAELVGLPPPMIYLMNQSGFLYALNIILAAYALRFTINLIPGAITRV